MNPSAVSRLSQRAGVAVAILVVAAATGAMACSGGASPTAAPTAASTASLRVVPAVLAMPVGASAALSAGLIGAAAAGTSEGASVTRLDPTAVTWRTTDPRVADITPQGSLVSRAAGRVEVLATFQNTTARGVLVVRAPAPLPDLRYQAVTSGGTATCARDDGGRPFCWGSDWYGQFGRATAGPLQVAAAPVPSFAGPYQDLDLGAAHACALDATGGAWCWGDNLYGQLGDGSRTRRLVPQQVRLPEPLASISAGAAVTCGRSAQDAVYCWGRLGAEDHLTPIRIPGPDRLRTVTAGGMHACAVTVDGAVVCWGRNDYGQLGAARAGAPDLTPVRVSDGVFADVAAGYLHTCATTPEGQAFCWGNGADGRLGAGDEVASSIPRPVTGGLRFRSVSAGATHTCGVLADGAAACWGSNLRRQLGAATTEIVSSRPLSFRAASGRFVTLSASNGDHTCGLTDAGRVECWGANDVGQTGVGFIATSAPGVSAVVDRPSPVADPVIP